MPPKAKEIKSISKKEQSTLTLTCEWDDCEHVYEKMDSFLNHVSSHIATLDVNNKYAQDGKLSQDALEDDDRFTCQWRRCGAEEPFTSFLVIVRHIYFHAYHTKLKSLAMCLIFKNDLDGCKLDSATRNFVPEISDNLECGWAVCMSTFDNPETFYKHVENHIDIYAKGNNPEGGCPCQWEGCDFIGKSKYRLRDHLRTHTQEKVLACPTCGGFYSNATKFFDHMKRQDIGNTQSFQCSHCNKLFSTERLLREHMRHHVNNYKCPLCDMTSPFPSDLRNHLRYRHSNERPFQCGQCSFRGKSASDVQYHMLVHVAEELQCEVEQCQFKCKRTSEMNAHIRKAHNKEIMQYICHICEAKFGRGVRLTRHLKAKHNFKWPAGHRRFRYKQHEDGLFRLQMVRYESIELTEELLQNKNTSKDNNDTNNDIVNKISSSSAQDSKKGDDFAYNLQMLGNVAAAMGIPASGPKSVDLISETDDDSMAATSVTGYTSDEASCSTVIEDYNGECQKKRKARSSHDNLNLSLVSVDSYAASTIPETPMHSPFGSSSKRVRKSLSPRKRSKQGQSDKKCNKYSMPSFRSPSSVVTDDASEWDYTHSPASTEPSSPWPRNEQEGSEYPSDTDVSMVFSPDDWRQRHSGSSPKKTAYLVGASNNHHIVVTSDVPVSFVRNSELDLGNNNAAANSDNDERDFEEEMLTAASEMGIVITD